MFGFDLNSKKNQISCFCSHGICTKNSNYCYIYWVIGCDCDLQNNQFCQIWSDNLSRIEEQNVTSPYSVILLNHKTIFDGDSFEK